PPVATVQGHRANPLIVPALHAREDAQRQVGGQFDAVPVDRFRTVWWHAAHGGFSQNHSYSPKNGKSRSSSFLSGRRPYSQISNASACCTLSALSLPYHSASVSR